MSITLKWHGTEAKHAVSEGALRGLHAAAEHVLEQSNRVVPIEQATLLRSGTAGTMSDLATREASAYVSYDTPYAVYQHEELGLHHDVGRTSKYLENTINAPAVKLGVDKLIAREIKREL